MRPFLIAMALFVLSLLTFAGFVYLLMNTEASRTNPYIFIFLLMFTAISLYVLKRAYVNVFKVATVEAYFLGEQDDKI